MNTYGYIVELVNRVTGPAASVARAFSDINRAAIVAAGGQNALRDSLRTTNGSMEQMRQARERLIAQRDLVDAQDIQSIRTYNQEIRRLDQQLDNLGSTGTSAMGGLREQLTQAVPQLALLGNPLVLAAGAMGGIVTKSIEFETGLAKVNTTAGLTEEGLAGLGDRLRSYGTDAGYANLSAIPEAFEGILGITNDVAKSEDILQVALKGAAAGFADVNTVGSALSNVMGSLGTSSEFTAQQIGNILFAAKRVGAGGLEDFAKYIPDLVASSQRLEITLEENAGLFAYFTAKGNEAAQSTTLISNLFTALGKNDVRKKFSEMGIVLEDSTGKVKPMVEIISQLQNLLSGKSVNDKANILDSLGLHDAQANQAISVLISDSVKLNEVMSAMKKDVDEVGTAFGNSQHTMREVDRLLSMVSNTALVLGSYVLPPLNLLLIGLNNTFSFIGDNLFWITPLLAGLSVLFLALGVNMALTTQTGFVFSAWTKAQALWSGILALANGTLSFSFLGVTMSVEAFTLAIYNIPLVGWILAAIAALGTMYVMWDDFRGVVNGIANTIWSIVKAVGLLFAGNPAGAFEEVKHAFSGQAFMESYNAATAEGKKEAEKNKAGAVPGQPGTASNPDAEANKATINSAVSDSASGGTRATQVVINLKSLVENLTLQSDDMAMNLEEAEAQMTELMFKVLNNAQLATSR